MFNFSFAKKLFFWNVNPSMLAADMIDDGLKRQTESEKVAPETHAKPSAEAKSTPLYTTETGQSSVPISPDVDKPVIFEPTLNDLQKKELHGRARVDEVFRRIEGSETDKVRRYKGMMRNRGAENPPSRK